MQGEGNDHLFMNVDTATSSIQQFHLFLLEKQKQRLDKRLTDLGYLRSSRSPLEPCFVSPSEKVSFFLKNLSLYVITS
jgi:hypothetical protein